MEEKKRNILQVFQLNVSNTQQSQKVLIAGSVKPDHWSFCDAGLWQDLFFFQVTDYAKLSIQNLQLAVYHSWNDTAAQVCKSYRHRITHSKYTVCLLGK